MRKFYASHRLQVDHHRLRFGVFAGHSRGHHTKPTFVRCADGRHFSNKFTQIVSGGEQFYCVVDRFSFYFIFPFFPFHSFSPKSVMLFGMIAQIVCGNLTGLVKTYELHVFFRCLSAVSCAQMYTAGQMICMFLQFRHLFISLQFTNRWGSHSQLRT